MKGSKKTPEKKMPAKPMMTKSEAFKMMLKGKKGK